MTSNFTLNITKKVPRDVAPQPPIVGKPSNQKLNALIELINSINDPESAYQINVGEYTLRGLKTALGRVSKEHGLPHLELWQEANGSVWARQRLEGEDD